jgi:hypothetical protein
MRSKKANTLSGDALGRLARLFAGLTTFQATSLLLYIVLPRIGVVPAARVDPTLLLLVLGMGLFVFGGFGLAVCLLDRTADRSHGLE